MWKTEEDRKRCKKNIESNLSFPILSWLLFYFYFFYVETFVTICGQNCGLNTKLWQKVFKEKIIKLGSSATHMKLNGKRERKPTITTSLFSYVIHFVFNKLFSYLTTFLPWLIVFFSAYCHSLPHTRKKK